MVASQNPSPYKCGACGLVGHNRRTCVAKPPGTPALDFRIGKNVKCGACGERGHNKRTCPVRHEGVFPPIINTIKCGACGLDGHNRRTCPSGCPEEGIPPPRTEWTPKHPPNTFPIFGTFGDFWCDEEYCTVGSDIDDDLPLSILQKPLVPPNQAMPLSLLMSVMDFGVRENVRKSPHSACFEEMLSRPRWDGGQDKVLKRLAFTQCALGESGWFYAPQDGDYDGDWGQPEVWTDNTDDMLAWNRLKVLTEIYACRREHNTTLVDVMGGEIWDIDCGDEGEYRTIHRALRTENEIRDIMEVIQQWNITTYITHIINAKRWDNKSPLSAQHKCRFSFLLPQIIGSVIVMNYPEFVGVNYERE